MSEKKELITSMISSSMLNGNSTSYIDELCESMIDSWFSSSFTDKDKKLFKYTCVQNAIEKDQINKVNGVIVSNIYTEYLDKLGENL